MNPQAPGSLLGMLISAAILCGPPATAQPTTSISTEYLMTVYLPKEAALAVDSALVISRDPAGGWVRGKGQWEGSRPICRLGEDHPK